MTLVTNTAQFNGDVRVQRKKPVLCTDFDECLSETVITINDYLNANHGFHLRLEDYTSYKWEDVWRVSAEEQHRLNREFQATEFFSTKMKVVPGGPEQIQRISEHFDVHIVTSREYFQRDRTQAFLDLHYPGLFPVADYWKSSNPLDNKVHFTNNYLSKAEQEQHKLLLMANEHGREQPELIEAASHTVGYPDEQPEIVEDLTKKAVHHHQQQQQASNSARSKWFMRNEQDFQRKSQWTSYLGAEYMVDDLPGNCLDTLEFGGIQQAFLFDYNHTWFWNHEFTFKGENSPLGADADEDDMDTIGEINRKLKRTFSWKEIGDQVCAKFER